MGRSYQRVGLRFVVALGVPVR
eukprot:COSAG03_NODE_6075_length_1119_cov_5.511765_1_plen_21_part_10